MYFSGFILNIANCAITIFLFIYLVFNEECLIEIKGLFCQAALTVADGAKGGVGRKNKFFQISSHFGKSKTF